MTTSTGMAQGTVWSLGSRAVAQVLQFATSVALARLIAPEAFGLVGMIATVTAFLGLFVEGGLGVALVQRRDVERRHLDGAFALTAALGCAFGALLLLLAPAVAAFYGAPILTPLTRASAASVVLSSLGVVPRSVLVRRMSLGTLALLDLASVAATAAVALGLALAGGGVWALVASTITGAAITSASSFVAAGWRPSARASWAAVRPLLRVGLPLLAFNAVNYWARTLDNVLIGAWIGERELGLYLRAYALMMLPLSEVTAVLATAVVPALARLQEDPAAVKAAYLKAVGIVALVSFPAMVGLSLVAAPFVEVVYGSRWTGVGPILQILALVGALQAVVNPVGWLYTSQGRTNLMFRWGLFATVIIVAALAYGASLGSGLQVARLYLIANVVLFVPAYAYVGRIVGLRLRDLGRAIGRSAAATAAMALCVAAAAAALPPAVGGAARLTLEVAIGIASYVVFSRLIHNPAALDAVGLVLELHPGWRRWIQPMASLLVAQRNARS